MGREASLSSDHPTLSPDKNIYTGSFNPVQFNPVLHPMPTFKKLYVHYNI